MSNNNSSNFGTYAGIALGLGGLAAIGTLLYNEYQEQQNHNSYSYETSSNSRQRIREEERRRTSRIREMDFERSQARMSEEEGGLVEALVEGPLAGLSAIGSMLSALHEGVQEQRNHNSYSRETSSQQRREEEERRNYLRIWEVENERLQARARKEEAQKTARQQIEAERQREKEQNEEILRFKTKELAKINEEFDKFFDASGGPESSDESDYFIDEINPNHRIKEKFRKTRQLEKEQRDLQRERDEELQREQDREANMLLEISNRKKKYGENCIVTWNPCTTDDESETENSYSNKTKASEFDKILNPEDEYDDTSLGFIASTCKDVKTKKKQMVANKTEVAKQLQHSENVQSQSKKKNKKKKNKKNKGNSNNKQDQTKMTRKK